MNFRTNLGKNLKDYHACHLSQAEVRGKESNWIQTSEGKKHQRKKNHLLKQKACYVEQKDEIRIRTFNALQPKIACVKIHQDMEYITTELKLHNNLEVIKRQEAEKYKNSAVEM